VRGRVPWRWSLLRTVWPTRFCRSASAGSGRAERLCECPERLCLTASAGYGRAEPLYPIAGALSLVLTTPRPRVSTMLRRSRRRAVAADVPSSCVLDAAEAKTGRHFTKEHGGAGSVPRAL
jgi:hypothetical protein